MERFLLAAHVVAGILFVGPVAVTTSLFPRYAPVLAGGPDVRSAGAAGVSPGAPHEHAAVGDPPGDGRSTAVAHVLHRVTRLYGTLALVVPLLGLVLAAVQGRLTEVWIVAAMVLTALAGGLLVLRITPIQREALHSPDDGTRLRSLHALAGAFNLVWVTVVVLMVVRPGYDA